MTTQEATPATQNLLPNEPELKDALNVLKREIFLGLNCHHLCTVQSFDKDKQVASATINYKKTYLQPHPTTGLYSPVTRDYPLLLDCPVVVLGGGAASLRFPITKGDECLALFNDRDMDTWFAGNSSSAVATSRLHSFSDAILLVGVRSLANSLKDYSADDIVLENGDNKLTIKKSGDVVTIAVGTGVLATFSNAGGFTVANSTGNFVFENNADISFDTGTVQGLFGHLGHVKFTNSTGELIAALTAALQALTLGTAGGNPFVLPPAFTTNVTIVNSFIDP